MLGKRIFSRNREVKPTVTEDEIKQWIDVGEEEGTIEEEEHEMLYRVFAFSDTRAKEVMTPRADVVMINRKSSLEDSINIFNETGFTRLPVYEEQIDNIVGILNVKDVFGVIYSPGHSAEIADLVYEPYFVPESKDRSTISCAICRKAKFTWQLLWMNTEPSQGSSQWRTFLRNLSVR